MNPENSKEAGPMVKESRQTPPAWLAQVVPLLSAVNHGINDNARRVAEWFQTHLGIDSSFYSASPTDAHPGVASAVDSTLAGLCRALTFQKHSEPASRCTVLFHFDYGSHGLWDIPLGILIFFRRLRKIAPDCKIVLFFHEFYPAAPERRREIFTRPLAMSALRKVLGLTSLIVCSNPMVEDQLVRMNTRRPILRVPIYSNVGEPDRETACGAKDDKHWVIFGSTGNLRRYLDNLIAHLPIIPPEHRPGSIDVIGGTVNLEIGALTRQLEMVARAPVRYAPNLPDADCSAALCRARYLYLAYFDHDPPRYPVLAMKSCVFAAASAHGVITVFGHTGMAGLRARTGFPGYVSLGGSGFGFPPAVRELSEEIHAWYQRESSLDCAAGRISAALDISTRWKRAATAS